MAVLSQLFFPATTTQQTTKKTNPNRSTTGHWLNHAKEHCLVGAKGDLSQLESFADGGYLKLDTDVIVSQPRESSRKPDEIYRIIERIAPRERKIEIFARPHNVWPGWTSVGNQLGGSRVVEPHMRDAKQFADDHPPAL